MSYTTMRSIFSMVSFDSFLSRYRIEDEIEALDKLASKQITARPRLTLGRAVVSTVLLGLILAISSMLSSCTQESRSLKKSLQKAQSAPRVDAQSEAKTLTGPETSFVHQEPVETIQAAETNPDKPAAIPVVTPEEARKLNEAANEYALAEKERREPFYKLYEEQEQNLDKVCFQGTVRATSTIPTPANNDYDNCLYALFVEIDSLLSNTQNIKIASEVIVNVPIMKDKTILQENQFLPGDKVLCTCAEYDAMPQSIQEIQLSDDIQSYEHQQYYPLKIKRTSEFQQGGNRDFARREITILPIQALPKDEKAAALRKERIQNEISRIEEEIKKHGGSFDKWKEEYKPIAEKYKKLCSEEYKGWINDSYFAAGGSETVYNTKQYIEGILPYKNYLEQNNIDLIVLRYPSKWDFAARVLASDDFQENPAWVEHYYECLKNDIEIVDPMPEMWKHRFDYPLFYYFNSAKEGHPLEGELMISAKVLSKSLERYSFPVEEDEISLREITYQSTDEKFLWPEGNDRFNIKEPFFFDQAIQNGVSIKTLSLNTSHPFLFVSNSFFGDFPLREKGASVPAYTSYCLQTKPDWSYQAGVNNALLRNLVSTPELLTSRKTVITVGAFNMWNRPFPLLPRYVLEGAKHIELEKTIDMISEDVVFMDSDLLTYSKGKDGYTEFTDNDKRILSFQINTPSVGNKTSCMLRINFSRINTNMIIDLFQADNDTVVDTVSLPSGDNLQADLFFATKDNPRMEIRFTLNNPERLLSIKNIELWYY